MPAYSALVATQGRLVRRRWVDRTSDAEPPEIEPAGVGPIADAAAMYDAARSMRSAPIGKASLAGILLVGLLLGRQARVREGLVGLILSLPGISEVARSYRLKPAHANWLEAFPFTTVAELPEGDKQPPHIPGLLGTEEARRVYGDGSFGGPYLAPAEVMEAVFSVALADVLDLLKFSGGNQ